MSLGIMSSKWTHFCQQYKKLTTSHCISILLNRTRSAVQRYYFERFLNNCRIKLIIRQQQCLYRSEYKWVSLIYTFKWEQNFKKRYIISNIWAIRNLKFCIASHSYQIQLVNLILHLSFPLTSIRIYIRNYSGLSMYRSFILGFCRK
jgi:hypothetical protein